jgi:hypothetical protein
MRGGVDGVGVAVRGGVDGVGVAMRGGGVGALSTTGMKAINGGGVNAAGVPAASRASVSNVVRRTPA